MPDEPQPLGENYKEVISGNIDIAFVNNVKKAIEDRVDDPENSEDRTFLYIGEPRRKSRSFDNWPFIAIKGVTEDGENEDKKTLNGETRSINGTIELIVETVDDSAIAKQDYLNIISDIKEAFRVKEKVNLGQNGMVGIELENDEPINGITEDDKPVLRREIELSFTSQVTFGG